MGSKQAKRLTPRQREWLGHLRAAARGGETVRGRVTFQDVIFGYDGVRQILHGVSFDV